jgi:general secretion pathway protein F
VGATFAYTAVDRRGKRLQGQEVAPSPAALTQALAGRGLLVLEMRPAQPAGVSGARPLGGRRTRGALEIARALAALLGAGLPLPRALDATTGMVRPDLTGVLDDVRNRVERGEPLASALAAHPALFSPLALGLIRAGERSGDLPRAFSRLADHLERAEALRSRLVSMSIYPALLASGGGLAVLVLLLFVLPRFAELLQGAGARLPRSTALLLTLATTLRERWPALLAVLVLAVGAGLGARATTRGRRAIARALLALPAIGTLRRDVLGARFARLAAVLLAGGAPLLGALDGTADSLGDPLAQDEVGRIRSRVREGAALHRALSESTVLPPLLGRLVALGEESGRLPDFLDKTADVLEERTQRTIQRLVALAEPAMIVVFGGLVGFVALALLQAIYSVNAGSFR